MPSKFIHLREGFEPEQTSKLPSPAEVNDFDLLIIEIEESGHMQYLGDDGTWIEIPEQEG
jgi:hypothetical protein